MADELYVEPTRLRELATTFYRAGQAIDAIVTNASTAAVAAALSGATTGAACGSGAQTARAAIGLVVGYYRTLHTADDGTASVTSAQTVTALALGPGKAVTALPVLDHGARTHTTAVQSALAGLGAADTETSTAINAALSSNAVGNFCFGVTLSYRRLERPRRDSERV
jgi:hypothetical protein